MNVKLLLATLAIAAVILHQSETTPPKPAQEAEPDLTDKWNQASLWERCNGLRQGENNE